jgi:hypothetical protein
MMRDHRFNMGAQNMVQVPQYFERWKDRHMVSYEFLAHEPHLTLPR